MAAMKTSVGRLYVLFNACLPNNEKVKARTLICRILESNEYNELKNYAPFADSFESYFSKEKLSEYSAEKLEEAERAIPLIIPLIENIGNSIEYGNALELTEKDIPDFTSVDSINELAAKLKIDQTESNVTNITKDHYWYIFSDKTIKDPTDILKTITAEEMKAPVGAVRQKLAGSLYCIRYNDIVNIQNDYLAKISAAQDKLNNVKKDRWKMRYKKWFFIGIAVVILTIISTFELIAAGAFAVLAFLSFLLLTVYFFVG